MLPDTRRAALRATARIALSATLASCQSATVTNTASTPGDVGQDTSTPTSDLGPLTDSTVATGCDPTSAGPESIACCTTQLDQSLGDAGGPVTSPTDLACCRYLAAQADITLRDGGIGEIPYRGQCCSALGWMGSLTCTPWGPPVPPGMPDEMQA